METETKPAQKSGPFSLKELENHVDEGRNKLLISCIRCPSKILNAGIAEYKDIEFALPKMTLRKDRKDENIEEEILNQYWMVADKFAFENIGFSNAVSGIQYLICADCEIGPIGWYDKSTQFCYVSVSRVNYRS
ncbi:hypothetical protein V9T40_000245 [Parthenolecanium corni]|uniref:Guanine nucleotide exchange factor MSS4 n=1 Tax=Parthenolecanium corni TaxID=536013 RepID=A0AAN9TQ24_9HEMI